jgi:hypothetical protein
MSDPRAELAGLYERAAAELEVAAQHARVAARRLREQEVPRSGAHAWAAHGHQLAAQELRNRGRHQEVRRAEENDHCKVGAPSRAAHVAIIGYHRR